ncbi:hypothetical protein [Paenibacillus methanolicus]|uniref:Uncharacterized protein n=1 Tax=Paenibacillus methanolicus TaxID=582686 RepID=A0A5S5CJM3_9BACL|nr:hypothetical protein [Paenibacillus methanolicus]TYP79213.1 hypothetical protein BCM02_101331 [Paenibacillus methanolicus]
MSKDAAMPDTAPCKRCGGASFGEGKVIGEGRVYPVRAFMLIGGSDLLLVFCLDCGEVASTRVKHPEKFHNH